MKKAVAGQIHDPCGKVTLRRIPVHMHGKWHRQASDTD
jgi:hypothetical protein